MDATQRCTFRHQRLWARTTTTRHIVVPVVNVRTEQKREEEPVTTVESPTAACN